MVRKVICALDTTDLGEALQVCDRLKGHVGAVKVGHGLTLAHGLEVIARIRDRGIDRVFLDLKFHDIPNTVALAVRQAAKYGAWMLTVHASGGPAMMAAAAEEAHYYGEEQAPLLVGVCVLTSLDQTALTDHVGVCRTIEEQMVHLSSLAMIADLDGVVSSPREVKAVRAVLNHGVIVTPGIRADGAPTHDQLRTGTAQQALADGADYLVMGRPLMMADDPVSVLTEYGFVAERNG